MCSIDIALTRTKLLSCHRSYTVPFRNPVTQLSGVFCVFVATFSDSHTRPARGNARTRLGIRIELGSAVGLSMLPSIVLVLPLAGLMCLLKTILISIFAILVMIKNVDCDMTIKFSYNLRKVDINWGAPPSSDNDFAVYYIYIHIYNNIIIVGMAFWSWVGPPKTCYALK